MTSPNQITAANAGWRTQFRFRGSRHRPGVADFYRSAEAMRLLQHLAGSSCVRSGKARCQRLLLCETLSAFGHTIHIASIPPNQTVQPMSFGALGIVGTA
jgi:hypothetical protein